MVFLHTRTTPIYLLPAGYVAIAMFFPDRWLYCYGLILALILYLGCNHLGKQLSFLIFKTADPTLYLPLGLGATLLLSYPLFAYTTARVTFWVVWGILAALAFSEWEMLRYRISRRYFLAAPFVILGIWSTFSPSILSDALVYHIGLPHQYLAIGQMKMIPHNFYSTFPPFDQVLNLLFAGMKAESGIKAFSIILYFHLVAVLASLLRWILSDRSPGGNGHDQMFSPPSTRGELLVIPMLMLPAAWIQIQALTPNLLVALFFCCAISTLIKEFEFLSYRKTFTVSLLLSFAIWTKWSPLLFIALFVLLWLPLHGWRLSKYEWKQLAVFYGFVFLCIAPLLARNYFLLGDPFYPGLSGIFSSSTWGKAQTLALHHDSFSHQTGKHEILTAPLLITINPDLYGPAAAIGLVFLFTLLVYPFANRNRTISRIGLYVLFCYLLWLFILHEFHHFFPVFLFTFLMTYVSLRFLDRFPKAVAACLIVCGLYSFYQLTPVYAALIAPGEMSKAYLASSTDTYSVADRLAKENRKGKILFLGETRIAYFRNPVIAPTAYDHHPLEDFILKSSSPENLLLKFRSENVDYIVINPGEFQKQAKKIGIVPTNLIPDRFQANSLTVYPEKSDSKVPLRKLPPEKKLIWEEFVSNYAKLLWQEKDLFVYHLTSGERD